MNIKERCEILRHCKWIDIVEPDTPYQCTVELLKDLDCAFYAHGDDPVISAEGIDCKAPLIKVGMYKEFKRTEGVSTTDITGKLLKMAERL